MGKDRLTSANGFTLVEVMVSLVFLLVAAMALLQGLELALRHYSLAQNRWKGTVELWNQVEQIRATHSSLPSSLSHGAQGFEAGRPLRLGGLE